MCVHQAGCYMLLHVVAHCRLCLAVAPLLAYLEANVLHYKLVHIQGDNLLAGLSRILTCKTLCRLLTQCILVSQMVVRKLTNHSDSKVFAKFRYLHLENSGL